MPTNIADAVPRLKRLIPRLRGKRIGVLGDLMLDRYLWGTVLTPDLTQIPLPPPSRLIRYHNAIPL